MINNETGYIHIYIDAKELEDYMKTRLEAYNEQYAGIDVSLSELDFNVAGDGMIEMRFITDYDKIKNIQNVNGRTFKFVAEN